MFRENGTIHRGTTEEVATRIGSHNHFLAYSHVAHDCLFGDKVIFANAATLAGHVIVEDFATIGAFSAIHQFCRYEIPWLTTRPSSAQPVGGTPDQTVRVEAAARRAGVITGVGYNYRWAPLVQHAKQLIDSGALGACLSARLTNCAADSNLPAGAYSLKTGKSGGLFRTRQIAAIVEYERNL